MVTMSQKELQRVKVIENAAGGRLSVREASRLLHLSERQVQRLKRRYPPDSTAWVHHGNRGRTTPWAVSAPQKELIVSLARGKYRGFNDSHLTEKLCAEEHLTVGREAVRRILRAAKVASPQKRRARKYRPPRPPPAFRHDGAHRCQPPRLAPRPWTRTYPHRLSGRCHRPDPRRSLPTGRRKYRRLSPRPPLHLSTQRPALDPGRTARRKTSPPPTGTRSRGARHSTDPRLLAPSQGPHRARLAHLPGPPGQRTSPRAGRHFGRGQRRAENLLRPLQPPLRPSRRPGRQRLPPPASPLRPQPLSGPALPTRRRRRSHGHFGRAVDPAAAASRPPRLRRRNRRTFPSTRWHPARLSRRRLAARSALAAGRTPPATPAAPDLGAEKKNPDAPRL